MKEEFYNFHRVSTMLEAKYGLVLNDNDVEELGLYAWKAIGNRYTKMYSYTVTVKDGIVQLPHNCDTVIAVTSTQEDAPAFDSIYGFTTRKFVLEQYLTFFRKDNNANHISGMFVAFEQDGRTLYVKAREQSQIQIFYEGVKVDEEGLPYLTEKEVVAITNYIAYTHLFKKAMLLMNKDALSFSQMIEAKWQLSCADARVQRMTENEWDEVLNVMTSWDRKQYNISFKID